MLQPQILFKNLQMVVVRGPLYWVVSLIMITPKSYVHQQEDYMQPLQVQMPRRVFTRPL